MSALARPILWARSLLKNEAFRYLIAGGWNSLFGILAFAAVWSISHERLGMWAIVAIAHLIATTQSFFVQRHLVFSATGEGAWREYAKFQLSYLGIFLIGALFVNGLSAQGAHPVLAQVCGTVLLAACGYFLGKTFTFKANSVDLKGGLIRLRGALYRLRWPIACFALSLLLFEAFWGAPFYRSATHIGHDFALTGTGLLEGKYWIDSNGLIAGLFNPPWFTPAWCGGSMVYGDPQSAFYSPLQMLALVVDPFTATHLNALLFAAIGYWGCYALARRAFSWEIAPSVVFAILAVANAFLPLRSAVGEAGYQPLYLWPLLALALCLKPARPRGWGHLWPSVCAGLVITSWIQFGFGGMLVPVVLATLSLCLWLVWSERASLAPIAIRLAAGGAVAGCLNASKLFESVSLMRNFPRDFYELPGFASLADAIAAIAFSLFQPSEWTAFFGQSRMRKLVFTPLPHEWAVEFGLGALALAVVSLALWACLKKKGFDPRHATPGPLHWLSLAGVLLILAIPPMLMWDNGALRSLLKQIPILNSAAWPMRWAILYLPLTQMAIAGCVRLFLSAAPRFPASLAMIASLGAIWAGPANEPLSYYLNAEDQNYNPTLVREAHAYSKTHAPVPILSLGIAPAGRWFAHRNDTMLFGVSQGACYNPMYGYRLESFPQFDRLSNGPILEAQNGQTRLLNPACLIHPKENACRPGDGFKASDPLQMSQAKALLERKPWEWQRPYAGRALANLSQLTFWLLFALCVMRLWQGALYSMRPIKPESSDSNSENERL